MQIPLIRTSCGEETIVKAFFQKLQPPYIAAAMLRLEIKSIDLAFDQLHQYLQQKDIQHFQNLADSAAKRSLSNTEKKWITTTNVSVSTADIPHGLQLI